MFRPIPLTILDFLAALLPGFIWLVLVSTTWALFACPSGPSAWPTAPTPLLGWDGLVAEVKNVGDTLGIFSIVIASLIIGYPIKAISMALAAILSRPLAALLREVRPGLTKRWEFPFTEFYSKTLMDTLSTLVIRRAGMRPKYLPRRQPFSTAKRYLRMAAPELWEESEQMEGEVRMVGALFLASLYCFSLELVLVLTSVLGDMTWRPRGAVLWCVFALIATVILGYAYHKLRYREVSYTYLNALLTDRRQVAIPGSRKEKRGHDSP